MSTYNVRKDIVDCLYEVLINKKLNNASLELDLYIKNDNDKALLKKEIYGVLENKILIEYIINKYSKVKTNKLDNYIYIVLLLGIYEILFLEKIPSFATINTYVELVKKSKYNRLSGFVNAILRNVDRNEKLDTINNDKNIDDTIKYSMPLDLYNIYKKYNIDIKSAIKKHIYIRIDSFDDEIKNNITKEFDDKKISYKKYNGLLDIKHFDVYETDDIKEILDTDAYKNGYLYIEDVSSIYMIEKLYEYCIDDACMNIVDMCSAPGGKILGLINLIKDKKIIATSLDISKDKINIIKENFDRENIHNIDIKINDATALNEKYIDKEDLVICDVPCSGLGVISKKPDIKYNFTKDKIDSLIKIQYKILDISKSYVKKNGYLSYSTCTILDEENKDNIDKFLKENKDFNLVYEKKIYQNDEEKADGFYVAIMKRL